MAASGDPSSKNGGFPVAISTTVHPKDQISAGELYPRWPLSITSGAMYCKVPANVSVTGHKPAKRLEVPKSEIFTTPLYVLTKTLSPLMKRDIDHHMEHKIYK